MDRRKLLSVLLILLAAVAQAEAQRRIPDNNLAYPVLVNYQTGTGSGFMLSSATMMYFVTARHVLYDKKTGQLHSPLITLTAFGDDPKDTGKFVFDLDLPALLGGGNVRDDPKQDVVVLRVATTDEKGNSNALPGVTLRSKGTSKVIGAALAAVKRFDDVLVSNSVMIFGYPRALGVPQIVPQFDPDRPLLRGGIVAGKNETTRRAIIIDCPSYGGNSGGPAVEVDTQGFQNRLMVIGVVLEWVPAVTDNGIANSGYTVLAPMDGVLDLVDAFEKKP